MIYGCIAEKLGHSFSKDIHNRLFDYSYELREVAKDELDSFMKNKDFKAINVTIPYKESVIPYLDHISDTAKLVGAVNTIVNTNGILSGYNTDFSGLCALLDHNGISLKDKNVLILGSGGTSKTSLAVASYLKAKSIHRVSREKRDGCITYTEAVSVYSDTDIIINTTPVGMYPNIGKSPIDIECFPRLTAVIDAVYNPLRSKLVSDALKKGIKAVGGLYMLVAQAALAAEKFIGKEVSVNEIDRVYREIIENKTNIVLIGMPGSGKTTIGKLLAKELGRSFIDTDADIVKREKKPIPQLFEEVGESGFRKIEKDVIFDISSVQNAVIATGGGAVLDEDNMDILKENGKIYFIDRDISSITATSDRPLSSNREALEKRYRERYPLYCTRCDRHIKICDEPKTNMQTIIKDFKNENTCFKRT